MDWLHQNFEATLPLCGLLLLSSMVTVVLVEVIWTAGSLWLRLREKFSNFASKMLSSTILTFVHSVQKGSHNRLELVPGTVNMMSLMLASTSPFRNLVKWNSNTTTIKNNSNDHIVEQYYFSTVGMVTMYMYGMLTCSCQWMECDPNVQVSFNLPSQVGTDWEKIIRILPLLVTVLCFLHCNTHSCRTKRTNTK